MTGVSTPVVGFSDSFSLRLPAYVISMPNMYARGILFGKMVIELGDTCTAKCEKLGVTADIEFRTKVHRPFPLSFLAFTTCVTLIWRIDRI